MALLNAATLPFGGLVPVEDAAITDKLNNQAKFIDYSNVEPVNCPCGLARRAFHDRDDVPYTMHVTEILETARSHYHKQLTETYFILECGEGAYLELDDKRVPVVPGVACLIPPGVVHRAVGRMKVLIVVTPKFDPADEFVRD